MNTPSDPLLTLTLDDAEATTRLGQALAAQLLPGDLVLLEGPIGAGKSHLARATIQSLLAEEGRFEDVPSPTFTLVQSYETERLGEVIHADLYRLGDPRDLDDIGLTDALGHAVCLIEWPDLIAIAPGQSHLKITLSAIGDGRLAKFSGLGWDKRLAQLAVGEQAK